MLKIKQSISSEECSSLAVYFCKISHVHIILESIKKLIVQKLVTSVVINHIISLEKICTGKINKVTKITTYCYDLGV